MLGLTAATSELITSLTSMALPSYRPSVGEALSIAARDGFLDMGQRCIWARLRSGNFCTPAALADR
jgi:hypothetical protein